MDPISLIVAALAAGASAAVKDTAGQAVKDAYSGLKALVKRKLGVEPDGAGGDRQARGGTGGLGEAAGG